MARARPIFPFPSLRKPSSLLPTLLHGKTALRRARRLPNRQFGEWSHPFFNLTPPFYIDPFFRIAVPKTAGQEGRFFLFPSFQSLFRKKRSSPGHSASQARQDRDIFCACSGYPLRLVFQFHRSAVPGPFSFPTSSLLPHYRPYLPRQDLFCLRASHRDLAPAIVFRKATGLLSGFCSFPERRPLYFQRLKGCGRYSSSKYSSFAPFLDFLPSGPQTFARF